MPKISKIRISNVVFNNSNRMIADELFNYEDIESGKPLTTLMNYENGTGKTVLIQLMMQPIIPKAKAQNRRIEGFLSRPKDHFYVVIEWTLDNSKEKLLTGISMASGLNNSTDADAINQCRYYTFMSHYQKDSDPYSIVNLPLSTRDNGKFIPATFDAIRELSKKSNGSIERFSSDDSVKWRNRLREYGIHQAEFRTIENLNSIEGGISKFFEPFKTSDNLIDSLLLPKVDPRAVSYDKNLDDNSLVNMMVEYSKVYSNRNKDVEERDLLLRFESRLKEMKPMADTLWNENDKFEKSILAMFGFEEAIHSRLEVLKKKREGLINEIESLHKQSEHIKIEKLSYKYYCAKDVFDETALKHKAALEEMNSNKEKYDSFKKEYELLECADLFTKLKEQDSKIEALRESIREKESELSGNQRLLSLKYSAKVALEKRISETEAVIKAAETQLASLEDEEQELTGILRTSKKNIEKLLKAISENSGKLEAIKRDTDRKAIKLDDGIFRMLDGYYNDSDFTNIRESAKKQISKNKETLQNLISEIEQIEERISEIPQLRADANTKKKELENALKKAEEEIRTYEIHEEKARNIFTFAGYELGVNTVSDVEKYFSSQISSIEAELTALDYQIRMETEEKNAADGGYLHIPHAVNEYLQSTGIKYQTVEQYLLKQIEFGNISNDKCQEILAQYPHAAYGIIVDEKVRKELLEEGNTAWLPSVLPVFTNKEFDEVYAGNVAGINFLSCFAKDYFNDVNSFVSKIEERIDSSKTLKAERKSSLEHYEKCIEDLSIYAEYGDNWLVIKQAEYSKTSSDLESVNKRIENFDSESAKLKNTRKKNIESKASLEDSIRRCEETISLCDDVLAQTEEERKIGREISDFSRDMESLKKQESENTEKLSSIQSEIRRLGSSIQGDKNLLDKNKEQHSDVKDAAESSLIDGNPEELYTQYNQLLNAQNMDIKSLKENLEEQISNAEFNRKRLAKKPYEKCEYENVRYTSEAEEEAKANASKYESLYHESEKIESKLGKEEASTSASLRAAEDRLSEIGAEALPREEIGANFDERRNTVEATISQKNSEEKDTDEESGSLEVIGSKAEITLGGYKRPQGNVRCELNNDRDDQYSELNSNLQAARNVVRDLHKSMEKFVDKIRTEFSDSLDTSKSIETFRSVLINSGEGDSYYTLTDHIEKSLHTVQLAINRINTNLEELDRHKHDLIQQSFITAKQLYDGLNTLATSSKIKVYGRKQQIIKFDFQATDEAVARESIERSIEDGVSDILEVYKNGDYDEADVKKIAEKTVGNKNLIRKYVGVENLGVRAYKIDQNPENCRYRTWKETITHNSGAEQFLAYFAIILSLLAYSRDIYDGLEDSGSSVLLLDNPFGSITSPHALNPMLEMARTYNVQLICLSAITEMDLAACFNHVIKGRLNKKVGRAVDQLTHEGNEMIEHGFYKSVQKQESFL